MDSPFLFPYRLSQGSVWFVASISDLPSPSGNVITVPAGASYFITVPLDLQGYRIECAGAAAFIGASPETCTITSTGLPSGEAIITTADSISLHKLGLIIPANCIGIDVEDGDAAIDWSYVNFTGTGRSVRFGNIDNAVMNTMGWIGADGILINGSANTIAITESIFTMSSGQTAVAFGGGGVINRRLRIESCAAPINAGATGFNVSSGNITNPEAFILTRINFSGGGTYLGTLDYLSDKVRFNECRGIINSTRIGAMSWTGNATVTTIGSAGVPVKIAVTSTANALNQRFTHTNNRLTYTSAIALTFYIGVTASLESGNNNQVDLLIYKNGVLIPGGIAAATTSGSGRAEGIAVQCVVELQQGDYIEVWTSNNTAANDITCTDANAITRSI